MDDGVRREVAGNGKIIAFVEEWSNTGEEYEYEYVVIDTGEESQGAAIRKQVDRVKALGWDAVNPETVDGSVVLGSSDLNARIKVEALQEFLREWDGGDGIPLEQRAALKIKSQISSPGSLVLVTLTSLE
ncbi:hypothetical protein [Streptosporangium sp. NBC_01756]|uniref:hypothetical protein n=1 Tax=Streptosporangium sp. NBC_01756 TaxID=2975950 RepID=UPI002DD8EABD|nr:hypothetical protein [Streptosporangium sp. NBC_01756]WSC87994.1 hypothetical protein OIE48_07215 [Streptosporangium sp. NBC_01756]